MRYVVDPAFAATLREIREQRGISLRKLEKPTLLSKTVLGDIQTGKRLPSADEAQRLDDALDAGGRLTRLVAAVDVELDEDRLAYAARHPRRTDQTAVADLAMLLGAQRRLEDTIGSGAVLRPAVAQLDTMTELVGEAHDGMRPRLLDLGAQWAQFTGWLHAATGDPARANEAFSKALEWATEAEDRDMIATALGFKGYLAEGAGHIGSMIGLSQAAQRDPQVFAAQRAYSAGQEARGRAMTGDEQAAITKISQAVEVSAEQDPEAVPPWSYYYTPNFFVIQTGIVYYELGAFSEHRNRQAGELLQAGLNGLEPEARNAEWVGVYLCHLGEAHLRARDREAATAVLDHARVIGAATRSRPVLDRIASVERKYGLSGECP